MMLPADPESSRAVTVDKTSKALSVTVLMSGFLFTEGQETALTAGNSGCTEHDRFNVSV